MCPSSSHSQDDLRKGIVVSTLQPKKGRFREVKWFAKVTHLGGSREGAVQTGLQRLGELFGTVTLWRRHWHPTPVLLPGKSHGRKSVVGGSPWGSEESDMTERLHFHFSLSCIGEGNGNPLQCSCLENPRDGGVWWAAVYGVTQSQTRLK